MMRARGVAVQGARPLAAATCWTRRPVFRPRPTWASLWVLGCNGMTKGALVPWGQQGSARALVSLPRS